ncbi:hypothetical protein BKA69DRAFT_1040549 [Paraphysoderma sedebokerense]|nr:hypothetical protein BKA69DRAFT_1040549 [Paraphysoderma sedebokerense]
MSLGIDIVRKPWVLSPSQVPYNNTFIFLGILGVSLNAFLLLKFAIRKRELKQGYLILLNMCFADLIASFAVSVTSISFAISTKLPWEMCQSTGMIIVTSTTVTAMCAVILSMERYSMIVLSSPLSHKKLIIGNVLIWCLATIFTTIPFMTETYYQVRSSGVLCFPDMTKLSNRHLAFSITAQVLVWTALILIPWCYWKIYKHAVTHGFKWGIRKGTITTATGSSTGTRKSTRELIVSNDALKFQLRLAKNFAAVILVFYCGWFGLGIGFASDMIRQTPASPAVNFVFGALRYFACSLNAIMVLTLDNRLKVRVGEQ